MKKIFLFLSILCSISTFSQAEFPEGIQLGGNASTVNSTKLLNQNPTTGTLDYINATSLPVSTATANALALKADISSVHNPVTIGTANGLSLSTQVLSLGLASSGVTGALSGTDWNTFNGKANANGSNASGTWGISISGNATTASTATTSNSVNNQSYTDANQQTTAGFRAFTSGGGATNFPFTAGVGIEIKRSAASLSSVGSFQLWSNNLNSDELLYFRRVVSFSGTESWSPWRKIATLNSADRFLLGTTTDNLTDIAQFNGSAIATAWKTNGGASTDYVTGTGSLINFASSVRTTPLTGFVSGAGTVSATDTVLQAINKLDGNNALKAPLASPALTGTPTAPTATAGTNTTQVATTAFVTGAVSTAVSSGNYTPTATNVANVANFQSNLGSRYTKIGNIVTITINIPITATANGTLTQASFTLPAGLNNVVSTAGILLGVGQSIGNGVIVHGKVVSLSSTTVRLDYTSLNTSTQEFHISFSYTTN